MTVELKITRNVRDRFVQAAVLLYLLDPVRGEPTTYRLDQDASNLQEPIEKGLKRKFLDSFALICATKQDGDTVSAACLEETGPEGTVIRIASNAEVSEVALSQLKDILGLLTSISNEVPFSPVRETELLVKIIRLNLAKIKKYVRNLQKSRGAFGESIVSLESRLVKTLPGDAMPTIRSFLTWFERIYVILQLSSEPDPSDLVRYVRWAQNAKSTHHSLLMLAFSNGDQPLSRWVHQVFKIGRYSIAAKALMRTAADLPALFNPIFVKPIAAPPRAQFSIRDEEMPLSRVLRRIPEIKPTELIPRLASVWNTEDPKAFFWGSFPADLVAHAEVQIVNFYDYNPEKTPRFQFIGTSKKSCYLCSQFLIAHLDGFHVSSCHQKLYLSWILPPMLDAKIYRRNKAITSEMSEKMELIARLDLLRRLQIKRHPIPADSTAGVSITGLTDLRKLEVTDEDYNEISNELAANTDTGQPDSTSEARTDSGNLTTHTHDSQRGSVSKTDLSERKSGCNDSRISVSSMVFHLKDSEDWRRQDIVMIGSLLDPHTHTPSWFKFLELLKQSDGFGLVFQDSDILLVNHHILVRNERQFIACLQYLLNSGILNSEVMICSERSILQSLRDRTER